MNANEVEDILLHLEIIITLSFALFFQTIFVFVINEGCMLNMMDIQCGNREREHDINRFNEHFLKVKSIEIQSQNYNIRFMST